MLPVGTDIETRNFPKATLTIIGINVLVFAIEALLPLKGLVWLLDHFGFSATTPNPITVISCMFLHGDIYHIAGNMLYLWLFGPPVEERIGAKRFVYYYLGAGLWATALWALMEQIARPGSDASVIGASGAISGVIALYLYRCFYSKLKMVIDPMFLPWKINIPAAPIIIFWFLKDMMGGIASMTSSTGISYWGHVGGYFFGLAVARIKRYGHEARLEHVKTRLLTKLQSGDGWKSVDAEKELLKLLRLTPDDPEVHHQLAQFYSSRGRSAEAEEHYQRAVQKYFFTNPLYGAFAIIEYLQALGRPMPSHYHLKAAEILSQAGWISDAYNAIRPLVVSQTQDAVTERALVLYIKLCLALDRKDEAMEAYRVFSERYPKSRFMADLHKSLSIKPQDLFPPKKEVLPLPASSSDDEEEDKPRSKPLRLLAFVARRVADPLFFFTWLLIDIALLLAILPDIRRFTAYDIFWKQPLMAFFAAFVIVTIFRTNWLEILKFTSRQSEEDARREVEISMTSNRARLAEKGENFSMAAGLYEKLLALTPDDIQARFNLARIYHHKLNDLEKAKRHYMELMKYAPAAHPFHHEAKEAVETLR